jgi:hypothetical protein
VGLEGGCVCGAVRYRLSARPFDCGYCHCRVRQRASAAPVLVFASVPKGSYEFAQGAPQKRRSSDIGERLHCADCGTPLAMHVAYQPDLIDITVITLDDPSAVAPQFHIWCESAVPWLEIADTLPDAVGGVEFRPGG